jgi:hypothetical protein
LKWKTWEDKVKLRALEQVLENVGWRKSEKRREHEKKKNVDP